MGLFLDKLVATFLNIWEQFLPFYATILSLESQNWFPATYFPIPAYFLPINFCRYFGPFGTILGPFDIIFGQGQFWGPFLATPGHTLAILCHHRPLFWTSWLVMAVKQSAWSILTENSLKIAQSGWK